MISNTCLNVLPRDIEFDFDWTALIICKIYPLNGVLYSDTAMSTYSVRYVKALSAKLPDNILAHSSHFRHWDLSRRGGRGGTWWRKVGTS